jgi:AhpD family alkylhydroperoxidase
MDYIKAAPGAYQAMLGLHKYLGTSGLDERLLNLVYLRVSQVNGCAFCVDMHWKDLRSQGEDDQRLYMLNAWREWSGYSERERAALEWAEAVTRLDHGEVPDSIFRQAREQFSEADLANLTLAIAVINSWNRLNIAFRKEAGKYQPPKMAMRG